MTLDPGTRLGPYEITAPLGVGGMGEVYRARDTRLDRTVALKVLPSHLAANPELRERFEREAKAISALNHPHICVLHDVGQQDGIDFLVMEYLEGETLADRLKRGALSLEQVLRYAVEIAEALDRAHRQGIVHRDLKPGNVMLTKSGAKLLDFGLAKLRSPGTHPLVAPELSSLRTEDKPLTAQGSIVGTFQYMAPEQLEGKEADARTDIFAFGAVLYEMATGKRAFTGKSHASLIGAILKDEPAPISSVQPLTPPALERVVATCLAKDPDDRWQNAHDLASELKWIAKAGSQAGVPAPLAARRRGRERLAWTVAGVVSALLGIVLVFVVGQLREGPEKPLQVHFQIPPPEKTTFWLETMPAVSPDGQYIVFAAIVRGAVSHLYVRALNSPIATLLAATEGGFFPFWSADARQIGFVAQGKLKKVDLSGGPAQTLYDVRGFFSGASWNREGVIAFSDSGEFNPALSPDEKSLAVGRHDPQRKTRDLWVFDLVRGTRTRLTFDPAEDFNPTWSPDGTRIAFTSDRRGRREIYQKLANGSGDDELLLPSQDLGNNVEDWSEDGKLLLYNRGGGENPPDLYLLPVSRGVDRKPIAFLPTEFVEEYGQFAPGGRWIAYGSNETGRLEVYVQGVSPDGVRGQGKWQVSTAGGLQPQWRRDGKELFYVSGSTLMAVDVKTDGVSFEAGIPKPLFEVPLPLSRRNRFVAALDGQRFLVNTVEQTSEPIQVLVNYQRHLLLQP